MNVDASATKRHDDHAALALRTLHIADAARIDGLKLVEIAGWPTLVYSVQEQGPEGQPQLVIYAVAIADLSRVQEIARVDRLLPPPPRWDAQATDDGYDLVYEAAAGATDSIVWRNAQGETRLVSMAHPFESFHRPHFVRTASGEPTTDIGATADKKAVVVFSSGAESPAKHVGLAPGDEGLVGGAGGHWVAAKIATSGPTMFEVLPGRLVVTTSGANVAQSIRIPDLIMFEFDAAALGDDVLIFATGNPAVLVRASRPAQLLPITAQAREELPQLSRPTLFVGARAIHIAALANPGSERAVVVYATLLRAVLEGS